MKTKDQLYELIRSLTKSEITFFKKYASLYSKGKTPTYVLIFNEMLKSKDLDEKKLKLKIGSSYAVHKHQLFEKLISALREMYSQEGNVNKSMNYIHVASVAARKQLYHITEYLLDKADKQLESDAISVTPPLLINHFRMMLMKSPHKSDMDIEELDVIYQKTRLSAHNYLIQQEINYLTTKTHYIMHSKTGEEKLTLLNEIEKEPILKDYNNISNPMDRMSALKIKHRILSTKKEYELAYQWMKKELEIMEEQKGLIQLNPMNLLVPTYNIAKEAIRLQKFDEAEHYIRKALNIGIDYQIPDNIALNTAIHSYSDPLKAQLLASRPPSQVTSSEIRDILKEHESFNQIEAKAALSHRIHFYLAIAHVKLGEFSEALGMLVDFEIEQHEKKLVGPYQIAVEILRMVCFYELEMIEVLESKIRSVYRKKTNLKIEGVLGLFRDLQKLIQEKESVRKWRNQIHLSKDFDETFVLFLNTWMDSKLN